MTYGINGGYYGGIIAVGFLEVRIYFVEPRYRAEFLIAFFHGDVFAKL